jgi:antitoxin YefM
MDQVCDDHEPVVITRQKQRSVVMLSLEDYESLTETAYLLKSRANARRLLSAVKQLEAGKGKPRKLNLAA